MPKFRFRRSGCVR